MCCYEFAVTAAECAGCDVVCCEWVVCGGWLAAPVAYLGLCEYFLGSASVVCTEAALCGVGSAVASPGGFGLAGWAALCGPRAEGVAAVFDAEPLGH